VPAPNGNYRAEYQREETTVAIPLTLNAICRPSDDIVARKIEDEILIVPLTAGIGDAEDELYTLNKTGQAIWQKLDGERTLGQVAALLGGEFNIAVDELEKDVLGFAFELVRRRILVAEA
jgi:Coenzyme PQQ synthesis protein D (PqqD)